MTDIQKLQNRLEQKTNECVEFNIKNCNLENQNAVLENKNKALNDYITRLELENENYMNDYEKRGLEIIKLQSENRIIIILGIVTMFIMFTAGYGIIEGWW